MDKTNNGKIGYFDKENHILCTTFVFNSFETFRASTEFISEALGHSNIKTTLSYLDGFENETKKQFSFSLTKFKINNWLIIDYSIHTL